MYADTVTSAMRNAIEETNRRRAVQGEYNAKNGIVPQTVVRAIMNVNPASGTIDYLNVPKLPRGERGLGSSGAAGANDIQERIAAMRLEMFTAAENLEFEKAARLRDELKKLQAMAGDGDGDGAAANANGAPSAFDPYASSGKRKSRPVSKGVTAKAGMQRNGRRLKTR
jgi:excinuclease ABC subunit B